MRTSNILILASAFFVIGAPAFAATTTATSTNSTSTTPVFVSFCDNVENLTSNVRADATEKASEHRVELEKISSAREEDKKKQNEVRAEIRQKEDIARESILEVFRLRATTQVSKDAVEYFGSTTGKLLKELRFSTDKAREDYAKVIRNVSLAERTKRNKALDSYIDKLDKANDFAEEQCAKGTKDQKVIFAYNTWLKNAKDELANNLKLKKSTLEQRAKEVHERELLRLESDYKRKVQHEIQVLTEKFPELLIQPQADGETNIQNSSSTPQAN